MAKTERLNVYVAPNIKEYVVKECEKLGMSQSAFITMIINFYKNDLLKNLSNQDIYFHNLCRLINIYKKSV